MEYVKKFVIVLAGLAVAKAAWDVYSGRPIWSA